MKENRQEIVFNEFKNKSYILNDLQSYVKTMLELRNLKGNPPELEMLMLTEEVGELAKAIRKDYSSLKIDNAKASNYGKASSEIIDVLIVLLGLCNSLDINLEQAFLEKESENIKREWGK